MQLPRNDNFLFYSAVLLRAAEQKKLPIWREIVGDRVLIEYDSNFYVNLDRELFDILFEGQLFEHLGFTLPQVIRTAIMKKDLMFKDYERLSESINKYNSIIGNLSMSEVVFLREHIYDTEIFIQQGLARFTWTSFNIDKFCDTINSQLRKLTSIVSQINFIRLDLRNRITNIRVINLFNLDGTKPVTDGQDLDDSSVRPTAASSKKHTTLVKSSVEEDEKKIQEEAACGTDVYLCQGYMERLEASRNQKAAVMKQLYDSLGPVLIKLESLVLGTFTGRSEKMRSYYEFWEEQTFKCIIE